MSKSRILLRIILTGMILGLGYIGYHLWSSSRPDYYWSRAQQAIEAEDFESAEMFLTKLVVKHAQHDRGWEALSQTILRRARKEGRPPTYAANRDAVSSLAMAAKLRPSDMDLQRRALYAYLELGQYGHAAEVAEIVYKAEPTNGDANFALTWQAVTKKQHAKAEKFFEAFPNIVSRHIFSTLTLRSMHYDELKDRDAYDETLRRAAGMAADVTSEQLALLDYRDRQAMLRLLMKRQVDTNDPIESLRRSKAVIDATRKLAEGKLLEPPLLAYTAAESIAHFYHKFPATKLESAHRIMRDELAAQAEELGRAAMDKSEGTAMPMLVYWNTSRSLMARGKLDEALATAEKGLAQAAAKGGQGNQDLDLHLLAARICLSQGKFPEANKHLDALIGVEAFEGWSQLLKGSMALKEGRLEKAHTHFRQARQIMGDTLLVRMSLAHTHMALKEWDRALPLLQSMVLDESQLPPEEQAWFRQLLGGGTRVHLDLLRARLALDQWQEAQQHLAALRDTELAPTAWALCVSYLWEQKKDRDKAKQIVALARERFPEDLTLALLEAGILEDDGESARATRFLREFARANPQDERRQVAYVRWLIRKKEFTTALEFLDDFESRGNLTTKAANTALVY
ncbi:MAG: hypothetical protein KDA41_01550, partial [Planctomycetales bacterium]|nr:hypothetical protein [Planctomycetales bacterium]